MNRTFGAEALPTSVTLVCDVCGRSVTTRLSGNTTRCPKRSGGCGNPIPVPTGSTRPPVTIGCYACGCQWDTRAREGSTVRCPECQHPRRVPTGARDRIDPGAPRAYREQPPQRPSSREAGPEHGRGLLGSLADLFRAGAGANDAPTSRRIDCLHCGNLWRTTAAPGNSIRCPECRRMRRIPTGSTRPAPARTTQARPAAAPRAPRPALALPALAPARPPAPRPALVGPIDPQTLPRAEQNRRDIACQTVGSLSIRSGLRVWYNQPPGACEALDTTLIPDEQRCPKPATRAVQFHNGPTTAVAYACTVHGPRLAALAQESPYITATLHPLRAR
ncbi:hypothetical protein [Streptomyces sp. NPDC002580]|uniref:hypothetical protein n=1 Tax=Streptomyces sp. NPDC002580 TaxID=3364653 RepID=UPI0036A25ABB